MRSRRSSSLAYPALGLVRRNEAGSFVTKSVTSEHQTGPVFDETGPVWTGSGGRIRTCDLWVMSPASYRAAPPRVGDATLRGRLRARQIAWPAINHPRWAQARLRALEQ